MSRSCNLVSFAQLLVFASVMRRSQRLFQVFAVCAAILYAAPPSHGELAENTAQAEPPNANAPAMNPADSALEIDVSSEQKVTLIGRSSSLHAALDELCRRANVDLRAYKAKDRPFAADFSDLALQQVLERLLRSETYMVGLRTEAGLPRVSWLLVTGTNTRPPSSPQPEIAGNLGRPFGVPQKTLDEALGSDDAAARNRATTAILAKLGSDPALFEEFAYSDVGTAVDRLAHYPYALDFLHRLRSSRADIEEQTKIEGVISTLEYRKRTQERASKITDPTAEGE